MFEKMYYKTRWFIKRNSGIILATISSVGVVTTAVLSVKATPKAIDVIKKYDGKEEKEDVINETKELVPICAPAVLSGIATITCIMVTGYLNKKTQISMAGTAMLLKETYNKYRKKIADEFGSDVDDRIHKEVIADQYKEAERIYDPDKELFYEDHYGEYFESTMEQVLEAEYRANQELMMTGYCTLADFLNYLGISAGNEANYIGWAVSDGMYEQQGYEWIDFQHESVAVDDNLACNIISYSIEPNDIREYM